ncbi:rhodanese-like domain-containing protein [Aureimonas frigidaquae]|uniref:Putative rhodanese-like sulfurtransferase n=1 Tax=Aureimonas frigidaquae TaxID=424757 RepID=A0A0P0Z044_9HYPH|nr:rhodanese-like domain-containing protein [Aureimonas frigidaquae]BAT27189.1 putative rhodanese-like sulfurtransferase [Aureimonas frigidaquae]
MNKAYKDDVTVQQCWDDLTASRDAFLIDVRTMAEWNFVGFPLAPDSAQEPIFMEWQSFPTMSVNPAFAERVAATVRERGGSESSRLYFLCRSGARSMASAAALTAAGFQNAFNILDGFEGPADEEGHRGRVAGWKAAGLSWVQK